MTTKKSATLYVTTDQGRGLTLCPLWDARAQEYLVLQEAVRAYTLAFGPLGEQELQLWTLGTRPRELTHTHFLDAYRLDQPQDVISIVDAAIDGVTLRRAPSLKLDLAAEALATQQRRRELLQTETAQFVMQRLPRGGAVGENHDTEPERHPGLTQFILVLEGQAEVQLSDAQKRPSARYALAPMQSVVVPPNTYHLVRNTGPGELCFFSVYSPPEK